MPGSEGGIWAGAEKHEGATFFGVCGCDDPFGCTGRGNRGWGVKYINLESQSGSISDCSDCLLGKMENDTEMIETSRINGEPVRQPRIVLVLAWHMGKPIQFLIH